ncbi:MAG: LysR family transcriptional regulator [Proteobacteria bacterium]|nr:MAG: LysR family transcriptional regulator [Pseudomonadota bacterium]
MDKDRLNGLLAVKLVAEKKNFAAAAEELGISAPAISKMIKQLETRLGVALLSRTTRSTSLTEAGEKFLNQAGPALEQILNALDDVGTYSKKPSGLLRLNVPRMVYPVYLAPIITSFLKKYPEVSVEVFFEDAASDVVGNGFDAGIRLSDILAEDMVALKLYGPVKFVIAGSPKYFKKMGRPKTPKDLLAHNCIMVRLGNWVYDKWEFEQKGKPFQVKVKGSLMLNDSFMALKAAVDGNGLMFVDAHVIADQLKSGELEIVLESYASVSSGFYLYYPQRSQVQPKLRAFIDHIKKIQVGTRLA